MKKVLLITLDFWPNFGGVANYYYNLSKNIPEIKILTSTPQTQESTLKIYNKKLLYKFFWPKWLKAFFETLKIIKKENIDILWVGELLPLGTIAYIINKLFKIPYFVSLHGLDIKLAMKNKRKLFLMKKILKNAKFITTNSQCTKSYLKNIVDNQNKIKVVYPGINLDFKNIDLEKKELIKQKYNLNNKKVILTVGRLVKRKNQELVIKTIANFKNELENIIYLIIGNGPELENIKEIVKKNGLENKVKFLENIGFEDLPYFYDLANIFIMVNKSLKNDLEGFGIVYLEAGIFKKPVIASENGGSQEAVINNKTGILIPENNPELLKNKILELLNNDELSKKIGEESFQRIKNNFLWKKISEELIKYINE